MRDDILPLMHHHQVVGLFEKHGKVKEYVVVSKRREANLSQAALMRMEDHTGALAAKKALNRVDFRGKPLNIRWWVAWRRSHA